MLFKSVRQRTIYLLVAASIILMLLGAPLVAPPVYAGDCPTASGNSC